MVTLSALTAALLLAAAPLRAQDSQSAAAQLGLGGFRFHKSHARVREVLPTVDEAARPWIKRTPDQLTVDLRGQFDPSTRRQGGYGTCAAFAAVAVAEAGIDRNGGMCTRLSEADLYLQGNVLHWDCWKDPKKDCRQNVAGANVWGMLNEIVQLGVLPGDDYRKFMSAYDKALAEDHDEAERAKRQKTSPHWFSSFLADPVDIDELVSRDRNEAYHHLERYAQASRSGNPAAVRRSVSRLFRGYRILRAKTEYVQNRWEMKPGTECAQHGKAVARFIDGELLMGRPVGVGMYLSGLKEWPTSASGQYSGHGFVVVGLTLTRDAHGVKKVYHTRNSWPAQPDISAEELCRVNDAVSLLGPRERQAPENPWTLLH